MHVPMKQLLDQRNEVYAVECQSCGFLLYARFLEDAKNLATRHNWSHQVSVHKAGDRPSW